MPQTSVTHDFKIVVDGITLSCRLSAPPGTPTSHITEKITLLERFVQNPDQIKLEFEQQTVIEGVTLRADKPKTGDREYSVALQITDAPMTDRSTLFNLAQTGRKVTIKVIEPEEPKARKAAKGEKTDKPEDAKEAKPENAKPLVEKDQAGVGRGKRTAHTGTAHKEPALQ